ncbi:MAG: DUF1587 domain-containing protein, partial [Myxococcota bacterium]
MGCAPRTGARICAPALRLLLLLSVGCSPGLRDGAGGTGDTVGEDNVGDDADASSSGDTTRFARLTHRQYENAVRDVLGLEQAPSLSQGFIGDVLSEGGFDNDSGRLQVSGELWLDYQRAAEALAQQVVEDPDLYAQVVIEDTREVVLGDDVSQRFEAEDDRLDATTGRATSNGWNLWSRGELIADLDVEFDATYTVSARVWASQAGDELARAAMSVNGAVLFEQEVVATSFDGAEVISDEIALGAGTHELSVGFLNDFYDGNNDRNLYVDWLEISAQPAVPEGEAGEAEAEAWIARFGERVHRRPLTDTQIDGYLSLWRLGADMAL